MTVPSQADANVSIPCGWRGPYLRLAVGADEITDGWGAPLANAATATIPVDTRFPVADLKVAPGTGFIFLRQPDSRPVANPGDEISLVISPGADGVQGGTGYNSDLSVTAAPSDYAASLAVTVSMLDVNGNPIYSTTNGDQVFIRVFGPDPQNIGRIGVQAATNLLNSYPWNYSFVGSLTQGPRAVRAYLQTGSGVITNSSAINYLNLHPGFNTAGLTLIRPY